MAQEGRLQIDIVLLFKPSVWKGVDVHPYHIHLRVKIPRMYSVQKQFSFGSSFFRSISHSCVSPMVKEINHLLLLFLFFQFSAE